MWLFPYFTADLIIFRMNLLPTGYVIIVSVMFVDICCVHWTDFISQCYKNRYEIIAKSLFYWRYVRASMKWKPTNIVAGILIRAICTTMNELKNKLNRHCFWCKNNQDYGILVEIDGFFNRKSIWNNLHIMGIFGRFYAISFSSHNY